MTDPCKFEPEIVIVIDRIPKMEEKLDNLIAVIKGVNDTKPGLIHKVLNNSTAVSRLWKLSIVIATVLLSGTIKIIFFS